MKKQLLIDFILSPHNRDLPVTAQLRAFLNNLSASSSSGSNELNGNELTPNSLLKLAKIIAPARQQCEELYWHLWFEVLSKKGYIEPIDPTLYSCDGDGDGVKMSESPFAPGSNFYAHVKALTHMRKQQGLESIDNPLVDEMKAYQQLFLELVFLELSKDVSPYYNLGISYITGKSPLAVSDNEYTKTAASGFAKPTKSDDYIRQHVQNAALKIAVIGPEKCKHFKEIIETKRGTKVSIIMTMANKEIIAMSINPISIALKQNLAKGLQILDAIARDGDAKASLTLAEFYAGISSTIETPADYLSKQKAEEYLKLVASQEPDKAPEVLTRNSR